MNGHERTCMCLECLDALADMLDAMATQAIGWQLKASWYGWDMRDQPCWRGQDQSLPVVSINSWLRWFARDDSGRRELIRAKVEVLIEAQRLMAS